MNSQSIAQARGSVSFPAFTGERIYMHKFYQKDGLPESMQRWQETVDDMLQGITTDLPIFMMVDQKVVEAGGQHRRPGVHVDGYWNEGLSCHGGGGHNGSSDGGGHSGSPGHSPYPVNGPGRVPTPPKGKSNNPVIKPKRPTPRKLAWTNVDFTAPEAILLASDVQACNAYLGNYQGVIGEGGDCSGIDLSGLSEIVLEANRVYAGNVCMLHSSLPMPRDAQRTLVRLNVPGWSPTIN